MKKLWKGTFMILLATVFLSITTFAQNSGTGSAEQVKALAAPRITSVVSRAAGISVTWNKVTNATRYKIYRKSGTANWVKIAETTATTYIDRNVKSGVKYTYTLKSMNGSSVSSYDKVGKSRTYIAAPALPSLAVVSSGVQVSWPRVTGAVKYRVFRRTTSGSWVRLADTTSLSYTDKTVRNGSYYYYYVRCINSSGTVYTSGFRVESKIRYISLVTRSAAKNAYKKFLENPNALQASSTTDVNFAVVDIDNDGLPELMVDYGGLNMKYEVLYGYVNGAVKEIQSFPYGGPEGYYPSAGLIVSKGQTWGIYNRNYYKLQADRSIEVLLYEQWSSPDALTVMDSGHHYYIGSPAERREVYKSQFESTLESLTGSRIISTIKYVVNVSANRTTYLR